MVVGPLWLCTLLDVVDIVSKASCFDANSQAILIICDDDEAMPSLVITNVLLSKTVWVFFYFQTTNYDLSFVIHAKHFGVLT